MRPPVRVPEAMALALLLVPILAPFASAGDAHLGHPDAPFPMPLAGEGGLYKVSTWIDGAAEPEAAEVYLAWDAESALVPGGAGRTFPTLSAIVFAPEGALGHAPRALALDALGAGLDPGRDHAASDPLLVHQRSAHVTRPGGDLLARSTAWFDKEVEAGDHRGQWVHRTARAGPCDADTPETLLARVTGLSREDAVAAAHACGAQAEAGGEPWTLVVRIQSRGNVTLVAAPGLSLPAAWTFETPRLRQEATLVGWRRGEAALPVAAPLAAPARLPLVDWTAEGPARGDLADHPFREAQRAVRAQTSEGAAFFGAHPDARVLFATHAWSRAATLATSETDAWGSRMKGVACGAPGVDATPPDGSGEWSISWVAEGASLFALAQRTALPLGLAPMERAVEATADSYGTAESGVPSTRAPAPADLAERLRDLDPWWPEGIDLLDYAFAPTAQGNVEGAAAVSRGRCERDPATGRVAYVGVSLWFVDGEARAFVGNTIQRTPSSSAGALLASLAPPPAQETRRAELPGGVVWVAGAALAGSAAAAVVLPRLAQALFTRIHRGDALDSEKRARLLEAIHRRPGAPLREVADGLGMPVNTAEHHARVLRRLKYVRRVRTAAGIAYYPAEHPRAAVAHVMDRAHADAVLAALAARPDQTQKELAGAVGMRKTHLSGLLGELEREGLVERRRDGRSVRVRATPRADALRARS